MSAPMTFQEFATMYAYIMENNQLCSVKGAAVPVKYVYPSIDTRTGHVFAVRLRPWYHADTVDFHVMNEQRDLPDSLHDRIMAYLRGEADA